LKIGVSTPFYQAEPDVMAFFSKVSLPIDFLNTTILDMTEHKVDAQDEALKFLKQHPEMWKTWVPADVAAKVQKSLGA
ncbi:MAG TPA: histidine ABC transporter substrate-binding protein, partial [Paraburkholderia sp.]|nr:histidine ABC transporter substrate-binding protein [Paraburkholderia sp.]